MSGILQSITKVGDRVVAAFKGGQQKKIIDDSLFGLGKKIGDPSEFNGTSPVNGLLQASMIAAGAIVENDNNSNGHYIKFENGLMFAFHSGNSIFTNGGIVTWTFPAPFQSLYWVQGTAFAWRGGDDSNYHYSYGAVAGRNDRNSLGTWTSAGEIRIKFVVHSQDGGNPTNAFRPLFFAVGTWK